MATVRTKIWVDAPSEGYVMSFRFVALYSNHRAWSIYGNDTSTFQEKSFQDFEFWIILYQKRNSLAKVRIGLSWRWSQSTRYGRNMGLIILPLLKSYLRPICIFHQYVAILFSDHQPKIYFYIPRASTQPESHSKANAVKNLHIILPFRYLTFKFNWKFCRLFTSSLF